MLTMSASASAAWRSSLRPAKLICIPNGSARSATAWPIRPRPTISSFAPRSSRPSQPSGSQVFQRPSRASRSPSGRLRAAARSSAIVRSAVASVRTCAATPTGIPRSAAAARSMLSQPTAKLATAFSCGALSSSSPSTRSVNSESNPSAPATPASSSSRVGGIEPPCTVTSWPPSRSRSIASPGRARATKIFAIARHDT